MPARRPRIAAQTAEAIARSPLSQVELADRIGVAQATMSRWATGTASPQSIHWPRIKEVLGIDLGVEPKIVTQPDEVAQLRRRVEKLQAQVESLTRSVAALGGAAAQPSTRGHRGATE